MDQLERIAHMEKVLDQAAAAQKKLEEALDACEAIRDDVAGLLDYYENGLWQQDFEDDEAGRLPEDLKRGVLSEDGVYDLISEQDELNRRLRKIIENDD